VDWVRFSDEGGEGGRLRVGTLCWGSERAAAQLTRKASRSTSSMSASFLRLDLRAALRGVPVAWGERRGGRRPLLRVGQRTGLADYTPQHQTGTGPQASKDCREGQEIFSLVVDSGARRRKIHRWGQRVRAVRAGRRGREIANLRLDIPPGSRAVPCGFVTGSAGGEPEGFTWGRDAVIRNFKRGGGGGGGGGPPAP